MPDSNNLRVFVGDGQPSEAFTALACVERPDIFAAPRAMFPVKTTEDTGNVKKYASGAIDGEEISLVVYHDLANAEQDTLRAAYASGDEVNLQFTVVSDGTTLTATAPFLVQSMAIQAADPNSDGEYTTQTFTVKQNGAYTEAEA